MTQTLLAPPRSRDLALNGPADILARRTGSSAKSVLHQAKLASLSADFAQTLNVSRAKADQAGKVDGKHDPRPERSDDELRAKKDESSSGADNADATDESSETESADKSSQDAAIASPDEVIDSQAGQQGLTPDTAGGEFQGQPDVSESPAESIGTLKPEQLVNQRPVTIDVLNVLLLQGNASPKFALVAPQARPGATLTRAASESTLPSKPSSTGQDAAAGVQAGTPVQSAVDPEIKPLDRRDPSQTAPVTGTQTRERQAENAPARAGAAAASSGEPGALNRAAPQPAAPSAPDVPRGSMPAVQPVESRSRADATSRPVVGIDSASSKLLDRLAGDRAQRTPDAAPTDKAAQFQRAIDAQLQRGVAQALQSSTGTVTLRLQPANLGQLKVQVKLEGQSIRAKFEVASVKTREMLRHSIENLKESLGEKGLKLEDVAVSLAPRLPERDLGLPPVHGQASDQLGPQFANVQTSAGDADMGGAHHPPQGDSQQPAEPGIADLPIFDEQPVTLIGDSVLIIGQDGRIRVDATA